jgi:ribosome-binding protein aMBF1 (putative translation factor)
MRTRGAVNLERQLETREMAQADLMRALGIKGGVVTRWVNGERRPEPHLREALERVLGIKATDWMTDDEYLVAFGRARRAA